MPGTASVSGLSSGMKTDEMIAKIMEYARRPQNNLRADKAKAQTKLTAWQDLNTRVLGLKIKADAIADTRYFRKMEVTSSSADILTASASTAAVAGSYQVKVTQVAQAHQVTSAPNAFTGVNDAVGTGTATIALENGSSFTVTLDSSNNTLTGLKDAINTENKGVRADIINAGTTESPDYRLMLTSSATGEDAGIQSITLALSGGTAPDFYDNSALRTVQAAQNAIITMGGGTGSTPIVIEKSTNTFNDVIPGVTLNILDADPTKIIKIDVNMDITGMKSAITDFTVQYNSLMDAIKLQTDYDSETGESGALLGDYQLQSVQMDIENALTNSVPGLTKQFSSISMIGISLDTSGRLQIDDAELTKALEKNPTEVMKIFTPDLTSNNAYVSYLSSTAKTKPGSWAVDVTQAAKRAQLTAGFSMDATLAAVETLTINKESIELDAGMSLDAAIARINSYSDKTHVTAMKTGADGTGTGNYLTFRQVQYGSSRDISVISSLSQNAGNDTTGFGNVLAKASSPLGQSGAGQGFMGLDVAGTINGQTATGVGQILMLNMTTGSNDANGVSLLVTAAAPISASVKFTKGATAALRDLLSNMTSKTGTLSTAQDGIRGLMSDMDKTIVDMEERLISQETRLYNQFNAMESQLSKLQSEGNYLASQFANMSN